MVPIQTHTSPATDKLSPEAFTFVMAILWLGLSYAFLASVAAHEHRPRLTVELSGRLLLAVVVGLLRDLVGHAAHLPWSAVRFRALD